MSDTDAKPEHDRDDTDVDVIEGEVVDEPIAAPKDPVHPASAPAKGAPKSIMGRMGWILAFGLAAFISGVAVAPKFDAGLIELGLKDTPSAPAQAMPGTDVRGLKAELAEVKAALTRHQEMLAQHEAELKDADSARQTLKDNLTTLATSERPAAASSASPQEIAALQNKVTELNNDVARLSELANSSDPAVKDLSGAIAIARAESTQLKSRLAALEKALQSVESGAIDASPRGRLILSLGRLKDRALTGLPYGQDLAALRPDFATLPALDQQKIGADLTLLEDHGLGVRSFDGLLADYDAAATEAVKAADKASGNFLTGLFTVRRTGAGATGLDATLAKAERALRARDVTGAVKVLAMLTGPAAEALKPWLDAARAYTDVEAAFGRLTALVAREDAQPAAQPNPEPTSEPTSGAKPVSKGGAAS